MMKNNKSSQPEPQCISLFSFGDQNKTLSKHTSSLTFQLEVTQHLLSYIKIKNWNRDFRQPQPKKVEFIAKQKWAYLEPKTNICKNNPQFDCSLIESQI